MADELTPSVFPRRWFPFLGPQQQVEEVVDVKVQICGHYDPAAIPDCTASYYDATANKVISIKFQHGEIWKTEAKHQDRFELVILGDDNRIYREGEPLRDGVVSLAWAVEKKAAKISLDNKTRFA